MDLKGRVFKKSLNFKAGLQNIWKGYNQVGRSSERRKR